MIPIPVMSMINGVKCYRDGKKKRDENSLRAKIITAIEKGNAYTPELIQKITGLEQADINTVLDEWEEDGFLACVRDGAQHIVKLENLKPLK